MRKDIPVKHHPLFHDDDDNNSLFGSDDVILSDEQKKDKFMSKYMDIIDPVKEYENYFKNSAKSCGHILRDIKMFYGKLVLDSEWDERKYVACVNDLLEKNVSINVATLDNAGRSFDKGLLASQIRAQRGSRRKVQKRVRRQ